MGDFIILPDDELKHYGVVGMKWDVHKGNNDEAFDKAVSKDIKLQLKTQKAYDKAEKYSGKAARASERAQKTGEQRDIDRAAKYSKKAEKKLEKARHLENKSNNWRKSMEHVFKNVSTKDVSKETKEKGKQYLYMLHDSKPKKTKPVKKSGDTKWKNKPITPITMSLKGLRK